MKNIICSKTFLHFISQQNLIERVNKFELLLCLPLCLGKRLHNDTIMIVIPLTFVLVKLNC